MEIKREHQINFWYIIAAFVAVLLIQDLLFQPIHIKTISYSEFEQLVDQRKVTDIVVGPDQITGTYKAPEDQASAPQGQARAPEAQPQHFVTRRVPQDLAETLAKKGLTFSGQPGPGLLQTALGWILPSLGFVLLWMFLVRPMSGQGMGGKMYGYGPGGGYGPGWMGPGMMGWGGYGPGADGWGPPQQANLNLTVDQVKNNKGRWLKATGNPHIKLGNVAEKDADTITADIVTTDNDGLVQRYEINRRTGFVETME